jgi:hypothetical protein
VYDADATVENVERHIVAEAYKARILEAIARYRDARQPAVLGRHALFTLAATLAFVAGVYFCWRVFRGLRARLSANIGSMSTMSPSSRSRSSRPSNSGGRCPGC